MPINFDRAEKIGSSPTDAPPSKRKVGSFEVLNSNNLIKWRCYTEETGQQHEHYDHYIKSFYANVEIRKDKMKMKKKKNE